MSNKKIVIFGGGTISHIANHLAFCAPAYGTTAKKLAELSKELIPKMDVDLRLTKMAGGSIETNDDLLESVNEVITDSTTKVVIFSTATVDYQVESLQYGNNQFLNEFTKYSTRLNSKNDINILAVQSSKIINLIRKNRKDIFLVGFKTTCGASSDEQYLAGLNLCKKASCNLVLANDVRSRFNMIVTPEESRYHETYNREEVLRGLLTMVNHRTHLTFTRSTIVDGQPVKWDEANIPLSLKTVVEYCISNNAYKPFNGVTTGHFAFKVNDNTFVTSIRRTNFNDIAKNGMVRIVTDGPDSVLAYGAKPSVGGQSQRIIFNDYKKENLDCIVHFHCPKKENSLVPTVSQYEFECGSHECGKNTSNGLKKFGNLYAVYLDNHGPNIVFNRSINPQEVIQFIEDNFDLSQKTGGYVQLLRNGEEGLPISSLQSLKDLNNEN